MIGLINTGDNGSLSATREAIGDVIMRERKNIIADTLIELPVDFGSVPPIVRARRRNRRAQGGENSQRDVIRTEINRIEFQGEERRRVGESEIKNRVTMRVHAKGIHLIQYRNFTIRTKLKKRVRVRGVDCITPFFIPHIEVTHDQTSPVLSACMEIIKDALNCASSR